jgi:hypothetical protein
MGRTLRTAPEQASPGARVAVQLCRPMHLMEFWARRLDVESGRLGGACRHLERAHFRLRDAEVYHGRIKGISTLRRRVRKCSTADGRAGKYRATQIRGKIEYPVTISSAPSASCLRQDPSGNAHLRLFRRNFLFPEFTISHPSEAPLHPAQKRLCERNCVYGLYGRA